MILEEETYKKFGYYPNEWSLGSHKKILIECDNCGKIFEIEKRRCCALCNLCSRKSKKHPNRKCAECGEMFFTIPSQIKKGWGIFCSRKCAGKYRSKNRRGDKSTNWRGGEVKRICLECKKIFYIKPSEIKKGKGKYCSVKCVNLARSKNYRGENNPSWKGGKIKRTCLHCGKEFEVIPSCVKKGGGKYCSYSCNTKAQRYNAKLQKSKPELIFEDICKRNNLPFHYVGDGQLWIGKRGAKQLNPDFIESNGKKICIEVMGDYWHSPLLNYNLRESVGLEYRKRHFKHFKWHPIFIWETDLLREDAEYFVIATLKDENVV
jgi:hypothetical protein